MFLLFLLFSVSKLFFFFSLELDPFLSIFLSYKILRLLCARGVAAMTMSHCDPYRSPLNFWMFFTTFSNFHLCSGLVYSQWMLVTSNLFLVLCAFDGMSTLFIVFTRNEFHFYIFFLFFVFCSVASIFIDSYSSCCWCVRCSIVCHSTMNTKSINGQQTYVPLVRESVNIDYEYVSKLYRIVRGILYNFSINK